MFVAALLIVGGATVSLLPLYLMSRAETQTKACFERFRKDGAGDPVKCLPVSSELDWAQKVPWFEADVVLLREQLSLRAAQLGYDKATAITPNASQRSLAASHLLKVGFGIASRETKESLLGRLYGGFADVAQYAMASDDKAVRAFGWRSARAIAAIETLRELSLKSDGSEHFALNLRRGALLCLLGNVDEGVLNLLFADAGYNKQHHQRSGLGEARLGLVACGKPAGLNGEIDARAVLDRYQPALTTLEASKGTVEGLDRVRDFLDDSENKIGGVHRLRLGMFVIREMRPSPVEALTLLAPQGSPAAKLDLPVLRTPWTLLDVGASTGAVLVDTAAAHASAAYLERMIAKMEPGALYCLGEECPVAPALNMPRRILKEAARMIWLEAATEHARRGHRDAALGAVARATALTPAERHYQSAPIHLAVGDAKGALERLERSSRSLVRPAMRAGLLINKALALAHLGRFELAFKSAAKAYANAVRAESAARAAGEVTSGDALVEDKIGAAWIWAAAAAKLDKTKDVVQALKKSPTNELGDVAEWLRIVGLPEDERRPERLVSLNLRKGTPTLPAMMYVLSRAVPPTVDVEVWLDRVFHDEHRSQAVRSMLARAEAARWRGDAPAEKKWKLAADKLLKRMGSYSAALLGHLVEIR